MLSVDACDWFVLQAAKYNPVNGQAKCQTCQHVQDSHSVRAGGYAGRYRRNQAYIDSQQRQAMQARRPKPVFANKDAFGRAFAHLQDPAQRVLAAEAAAASCLRRPADIATTHVAPMDTSSSATTAMPNLRSGPSDYVSGGHGLMGTRRLSSSSTLSLVPLPPPPPSVASRIAIMSPAKPKGKGYDHRYSDALAKRSGPSASIAQLVAYVVAGRVVPTCAHEEVLR